MNLNEVGTDDVISTLKEDCTLMARRAEMAKAEGDEIGRLMAMAKLEAYARALSLVQEVKEVRL